MGTHNLCFEAKIRKIGIPLQAPVYYIKVGYEGVYSFHGHVVLTLGLSIYLVNSTFFACMISDIQMTQSTARVVSTDLPFIFLKNPMT